MKDFVFSDLKRVKFISWLYFPARTMELPVDDETELCLRLGVHCERDEARRKTVEYMCEEGNSLI